MHGKLTRLVIVPVAVSAVVAGTVLTAASVGTAVTSAPHATAGNVTTLHTVLTGAQEVPGPGDPDGHGAFAAGVSGDRLCYVLAATRIEPPVAAHIHAAPAGVAGGIVVGLETPDRVSSGCIETVDDSQNTTATLTDSELAAIVADPSGFYVNVHTPSQPAGAIRGQLR